MNRTTHTDDELLDAFVCFSRAVLARLAACTDGRGYVEVIDVGIEFTAGGWSDRLKTRSSTHPFWKRYLDEQWWRSPDAVGISELFVAAGLLRVPRMIDNSGQAIADPTPEMVAGAVASEIIKPILGAAAAHRTVDVPKSALREVFQRHLRFWRTEDFECRIVAPLVNFRMDRERLDIRDRLAILPFEDCDKSFLYNHLGQLDGTFTARVISNTPFALTARTTRTRSQDIEMRPWMEVVRLCVTAMRLLGMGSVGAPRVTCLHCEPLLGPGGKTSFLDDLAVQESGGTTVQASSLDALPALYDTLARISEKKDSGGLRLALNRYNLSFGRRLRADSLIDLVIAIEASLLHGKKGGNNSRLAAQRAAALLAAEHDPSQIALRVQTLSDSRNEIVHKGLPFGELKIPSAAKSLRPKVTSAHEISELAFETARQILMAYLRTIENGRELHQINQELDKAMYRGLECLRRHSSGAT